MTNKNDRKTTDYLDPETKKFKEGNPGGGRPKGTFSLVTLLKKELQKCPEGQDKKTFADMLIRRILKEAIENGEPQQIKNILNYVEGMPTQKLIGDPEEPIVFKWDN